MNLEEMKQNATRAADLMRAMSNRHRLMLLCLLNNRELSVTELNNELEISQSTLSQHLSVLRKEGFVKTRRDAQTIYYSLAGHEVTKVIGVLYQLYCEPRETSK